MEPNDKQFPESDKPRYWSESPRPEHAFISRYADEVNREEFAQKHMNTPIAELRRMAQEEADNDPAVKHGLVASKFEVSGDALARAKAGMPPKQGWDLKRD